MRTMRPLLKFSARSGGRAAQHSISLMGGRKVTHRDISVVHMVSSNPGYTGPTSGIRWDTAKIQNPLRFEGPPKSRATPTVLAISALIGFLLVVFCRGRLLPPKYLDHISPMPDMVRIPRVFLVSIPIGPSRASSFSSKTFLRRGVTRGEESPMCESSNPSGILIGEGSSTRPIGFYVGRHGEIERTKSH